MNDRRVAAKLSHRRFQIQTLVAKFRPYRLFCHTSLWRRHPLKSPDLRIGRRLPPLKFQQLAGHCLPDLTNHPMRVLQLSQVLVYGGAIAPNLGAFAQVTYDGGSRIPGAGPIGRMEEVG